MKNRKAIAFVMVLAMIFCYIPPATYAIEQPTNFVDMPQEGFWSTQALQAAVNNGLLQGFEKPEGFYVKPNDTLTRAQMATIVNRAFGATEKAELSGVADVPENAWYREEIQKAVKMGTMKSAQKMRPNDPITRQEAFTVLARAFRATGGTTDHLVQFQDAGLVASWALDGMGALVQDGYVKGSGGKLSPKNNITRAEFAVIMDNMVKQYVKVAGTVTDVVSEGNVVINVPGATLKDVTISGDLIIGDGVGNGNITLDNVTVQGDLIARGGGVNSIIIVGGSVEGKIVVSKVDGQIRVSVEGGAEVEVIVVDDGQDDVILEGTIGTVEITAAETPVLVRNANIQQVTIAPSAIGSSLHVSGTVSNLTVQGQGATVTANSGGTITNVTSQSDGVTITGTGNVGTVIVEGNNTTINTNNTSVTLDTGVVGTIINDEPQDTPTQPTQVDTEPTPPPAGGGGGTPSPTVLVAEIEVTSTAIEITVDNGTLSMTAVVSPAGATNQNVTWSVSGAAATINSSGLLTAITNGAVTVFAVAQDGSGVSGQLEITISGQVPDIVDYPTIAGVEMPAKWGSPDIRITETDQFTGTISWSPDDSPFGSSTSYTATITLTAKDGYTLTGIANNFFIVPGATTVSSVGHIVTAQYPVTDPPEYSTTGALTVDSIAVTYGATSAEVLGRLGTLIPTVSVSGTLDGESDTATITWISITNYSGTSAGAYEAIGELAIPGSWIYTGDQPTVSAIVNVSPAAFAAADELTTTRIYVTYGATSIQAIALLDTSVGITGTLDERGTADIVWNIAGYYATSAGAYEATGTLTLPNSWTGTGTVTATVNVSPAAYASTDALATTSVSVTYGAVEAEALGLLQSSVPTVGVNGTNGEDGTATITWTAIAAYDATSPGSYVASGTLGLPVSWSGSPGAVTAAVIVLPVEYISTEALTTQAIWVTYGATSAEAIALLDTQAVVNGTNDEQATVNITWTDITNYSGTSAGAYEAIGELAIPGSWIYTGDQPTVSAIVNVSPAAFAAADELTTTRIYVTYGATSIQAIALLDTSVGITGTLGERGTADIVWNIAGYDATSAGAYEATGTLTLPNSWTGTGTVTATVNVSPAAYASTDALATTSVSVTYGAVEAEALGLLQSTVPTVGVNGTNGEDGTATITWTAIAAYDATSPGSYVASGTLGLPASWSGSPGAVTAAVIVLPQGDQSGFTLAVIPGAPTIEGIQFGLSITNAATTAGIPLTGEQTVVVSSQEGYLGTYDDSVVDGGTGQLTTFSTTVEFEDGGGGLPIFISAPGIFHLTVTVEGITTSQSIEVVITESAADISYEVPVIYLGSTTPAYITVTGIWDASGNSRADDFSNDVGMMFDFGLLFEDDPEQIPGVVTKSATSMLIEIPNPSLLTTPGAYKITIDMEDGNWWDIPFEVTVSAVGYTPQQMALYARFGSLVLDMEIEDSEGNILTWAAISDDVNLEESVIEIQASSGEVTPVVITFGGLVSHINDIANTITFDGEPGLTGLSGMSTSDFAIGGILEGFVPFEHDTVNVTIKAIDATWLVTASAVIPYLSIQHGQNVGDTLDLTVVYENMEGPTLSALSPANVNLLPAFSTEYDTASDNKVTVAAMGGGEYLYAYAWIPDPGMTTDGINTLEMAYNAGNNTFTISGTKDDAVTVDAIGVLYFYDSSTHTINYINLDFYTGAGEETNVDINYMPRVEEVTSDDGGSTLTVVFDSAMSGSSITNTANYTYSSSGNPITIAAVSYDEGAWAATVTIQEIVAVGDLFTISNDNELVDVQGFELSQQQYLLTTGGVWIENMGGPGGPEDSISLYEDEGGTAPSSTFEMGDIIYVLINDPTQSGTAMGTVEYHVSSSTDATGVTLVAIDYSGNNMFGNGFLISGMPSDNTSPEAYNVNATFGGIITVTYGGEDVTATVTDSGGGGGSVPDGLNVEVEFGSLELYIDPTIGGAVTTMSSVGVISPSSVICFFEVENPTNKIEYTLSELGADENVTIDWENNLVVLSGAVDGFARSGVFTTSPAGLFSDFQYGIHDRVMVTLSGIVGETPYEVTTEAIIPYIGLGNASQSGLALIYDVEVNYDLSLTEEEAGSYTNVSLYGLSYSPGIEGAALEAIEATTPVAVGDGGADQIGRLQAFYVGEEVPEEEYSMDNIGDVLMTLDPTTSTYAITATKTDANTTISAFIHLFLVDTEYGNRSFATFEILSDAGSSDVLVQEMGMPPGDVALTTTASHITWTPQADATGYVINLYKDYETETTPIYTTTVEIDGVLPFEIGPTIYSLGAGTGNYSARVQILGGTSDGVWLESSVSVYVTQMEQVTGLIVSGGVLHWDLLSSNNYGVEIYISYGEEEQPLITTLNDGESGYDLITNGVLTDSAMDYTISVYAAGEPYTVIKSITPATIVFHDDRQDPTGATGGAFYGLDNNAAEGQSFEEVGGYGVGDAIRLMFTEPIRYDNLAISDFQLSEGSTWGTTTEGAITFDDGVENYFGAYSEGIVIELQTGAYIASTASITIPEGALQDILGNTNTALVIPVEEPFVDSSGTTHASVDTYEEFESAMADEAIELIGINQDMSATTFAITRPIEILFDGHTLTGTVSITTSALGEVTLSAPGTIAGILMIDAPNLTVNNEVTVTGETIIEGVGYDSYNSSGSQGGGILVNGPARLNLSASATSATVGIDTSQMVVLDGSIQTVQLMASGSKARVLGTVTTLTVTTGAIGSLIEAYSGSSIGQVLASESTMLMKETGATVGSTTGAVLENVAYRVTFDKNGGDTQASPTYLLWDNNTETSNAMPTPPTKADFTFGGWNSQSHGGGTMMTTVYAVSSPVTAYAIWEAGDVEIENYDPFTPIDGGDVGTPAYEDATAVITYLESTLTCAAITGQSQVVPISGWADTDSYTSSVAASYTFTASVGTLPEGFVDEISPITHVTVEVVVSAVEPPVITTITAVEGGTLTVGIDDGDTITIEFDVPTNYANLPSNPDTVSQEGVDSFIQLHTDRLGVTPTLGAAYYGFWETTTRFVITIDDSTGANLIVGDEISIRQSADLKTQNELSVASTSRAEVTGSFDPVYNGAVGLVKSTTGMAISGVEVYAGSIGSSYSDITDENGMYEIDYPTEGSITTFYVHDYWFDDVADNLSVPNPGYFEKTMSIGAKITGTVTYNGSWAVGFTVKDGSAGTEAIVGADGSFSLRGVPSGTGGSTRYLNVLDLSGISVIEGSLIEVGTIAFQTTSGVAIVIP